jgi:hypothetical protein
MPFHKYTLMDGVKVATVNEIMDEDRIQRDGWHAVQEPQHRNST